MHSLETIVLLRQTGLTPECYTKIRHENSSRTTQTCLKMDENLTTHSDVETNGADGKREIGNVNSNLYPLNTYTQWCPQLITTDFNYTRYILTQVTARIPHKNAKRITTTAAACAAAAAAATTTTFGFGLIGQLFHCSSNSGHTHKWESFFTGRMSFVT